MSFSKAGCRDLERIAIYAIRHRMQSSCSTAAFQVGWMARSNYFCSVPGQKNMSSLHRLSVRWQENMSLHNKKYGTHSSEFRIICLIKIFSLFVSEVIHAETGEVLWRHGLIRQAEYFCYFEMEKRSPPAT